MKNIIIPAICLFIISCSTGDQSIPNTAGSPTARISGDFSYSNDTIVSILKLASIGDDVELVNEPVARGQFDVEVPVSEEGMYILRIGRAQHELYLQPGDDLRITARADNLDSISMAGSAAAVNQYLIDRIRNQTRFSESYGNTNAYRQDVPEFVERNAKLRDIQHANLTAFLKEAKTTRQFEFMAKADIDWAWATRMANYPRYHAYYMRIENFEVDEDFYAFKEDLDVNNEAYLVSPQFRSYLVGSTSLQLSEMVDSDEKYEDEWELAYRDLYTWIAENDDYTGEVENFLLANALNDYISFFGTQGAEEIMADYKSRSNNEEFLPVIEENYNRWARIAPGQPAPDFAYESIGGETVNLSDLKGKVVYLDVWATWCGPCKREIPASKALKKKYASTGQVEFLYVSVDNDMRAWRDYLAEDPEFKGIHVITGTGWKSTITDAYNIQGIPRYILVDQAGRIVTANAPRPSSGEKIEGLISGLLEPEGDAGD